MAAFQHSAAQPQAPATPAFQPSLLSNQPTQLKAAPRRSVSLLDWTGTILVVVAIAFLAYLAWLFVGTNVVASVEQSKARQHLEKVTPVPAVDVVQTPVPVIPADGNEVGRIIIPSLGVDQVLISGTQTEDLKRGPGIWSAGAFPGVPGNSTISGHRTTYGGPFRHIDQLKYGDKIIIAVAGQPDAVFEVRGNTVVEPSRIQVTSDTPGVRLTLTTCDPVGSDAKRLVVQSELVAGRFADDATPREGWQVQE